ncbi:MAG: hypothetical protein RR054_00790 [Clostridia bacterium]
MSNKNDTLQEKLTFKELLDKGLHLWLFLGGIIILIVCALVWGCTYQIRSTVVVNGITHNNTVVCYVDAKTASKLSSGMEVSINGIYSGSVSIIAKLPYSKAEVMATLKGQFIDYTAATLNLSEWNYKVIITLDSGIEDNKLVKLTVITQVKRPIDFFGKIGANV